MSQLWVWGTKCRDRLCCSLSNVLAHYVGADHTCLHFFDEHLRNKRRGVTMEPRGVASIYAARSLCNQVSMQPDQFSSAHEILEQLW